MINDLTSMQRGLYEYWLSLPRLEQSLLPHKSALRSSELIPMLENIGMAEFICDYNLQVRHVGSGVDEKFYETMQYQNAFDFTHENAHDFINSHWQRVFTTPCATQMIIASRPVGQNAFELISFHLPLLNSEGVAAHVISIFERGETLDHLEPNTQGLIYKEDILDFIYMDLGAGIPNNV
ncbi:hypothetical protein QGN29_00560 [Temperatibacter marinus]|uniref:PAS domain-containing protein n=1 Tax=Temperatibacter marinus TaxID=1456591 RepID=A0AA52ECG1_9PROT|nr:hypothetical protein [Temperatibacter marinus]WND02852.1 hypothetical protein QGN29_00560 [Temperatibacter marinus]